MGSNGWSIPHLGNPGLPDAAMPNFIAYSNNFAIVRRVEVPGDTRSPVAVTDYRESDHKYFRFLALLLKKR